MTLPSDVVFDPDESEPIYAWYESNGIGKPWSVEGTMCATAHFKKDENGEWVAQPQCADWWIGHDGRERVTIVKGDTLRWTGTEIIVLHTGEADRPSYYASLRIPT